MIDKKVPASRILKRCHRRAVQMAEGRFCSLKTYARQMANGGDFGHLPWLAQAAQRWLAAK